MIELIGVKKYFPVTKGLFRKAAGYVKAVDGVTFKIEAGRTLGLVGESACGKTTIGRIALGLLEPDEGKVLVEGKDITKIDKNTMRDLRPEMQPIFQDPFGSLNPRMRVGPIILEGPKIQGKKDLGGLVERLLESVGLPYDAVRRYPHQFSGGQRQRIGIARAIATNPRFLVCDEPVSSLDVSIQAQILNLLKELQKKLRFSCLFIAHDLAVVEYMSDRVAVMYLGKIVEEASKEELYKNPLHPYTKLLLLSIPVPDPKLARDKKRISSTLPLRQDLSKGCRFRPRCPYAKDVCAGAEPELAEVAPGHYAACYL